MHLPEEYTGLMQTYRFVWNLFSILNLCNQSILALFSIVTRNLLYNQSLIMLFVVKLW